MGITDIVRIRHKKTSSVPAPSDPSKIGGPDFNDDHAFDLGECLSALGVLVLAADKLPYFDASKNGQLASLTAFARTLLASADGPAALDALGNNLRAFAALVASPNKFPNFDNSGNLSLSDVTVVARNVLACTTNPAILAAIGAVAKAGDTMTGALNLAADPVSGLQAATKQYVDAVSAGLKPKGSAKAASTANVNIASAPASLDTIAGANGDLWLLKNQTAPAENGLYVFNGTGSALTRASNMSAWAQVPGATVVIEQGATWADSGWVCTADQGGTLGTTAITWSEFFGTGLYQAASSILSTLSALSSVANLTAEAGLTGAADKVSYYTGSGAKALADFTSVARTLLAATTQAGQRSALALGGAATANIGGANGVAGLDASGKLLGYDGSALINLPTSGVIIGSISWICTSVVPSNTLKCNGASYLRATYPSLFAALVKSGAVTFTNGSANIGWTGHGLSVGDPIKLFTTGTLPTNFAAGTHGLVTVGTVYYVSSVVDANTFQVSATAGGAAVSAGSAGSGTHTAVCAPHGDGDGSTTFTVPEMRGEGVRAWDDGRGIDTNRVIGSAQLDQLQGHAHTVGQPGNGGLTATASGGGYAAWYQFNGSMTSSAPVNDGTNGAPRFGLETRMRNVALMPVVRYA